MSFPVAEIDRRLANILRIGVVAALDAANALVQVDLGDLTTDWLPWSTGRAGNTRKWSAPRVGEQVLVFSPSGELGAGIVGPSVFQDAHGAPSSNPDAENVTFSDGSSVNYDAGSNTLTVNVSGAGNVVVNCQHATINAQDDVTLNTPQAHCTGNMQVDGALSVSGGMSIQGGGGSTATITGKVQVVGDVVTTGALTNNGKSVGSTHTHGGVQSGGSNTAAPN